MARRTKKAGPTGGLGVRYGSTLRKRYKKVVQDLNKKHKCPKCEFVRVKRISTGLWKCRKCDAVFSGGAYSPKTKIGEISERVAKAVST